MVGQIARNWRRIAAWRADPSEAGATTAEAGGTRAQLGGEAISSIGTIESDASLFIGDVRDHLSCLERRLGRALLFRGLHGASVTLAAEQPVDDRLQRDPDQGGPVHDGTRDVAETSAGRTPAAESRAISFGVSVSPSHLAVVGA